MLILVVIDVYNLEDMVIDIFISVIIIIDGEMVIVDELIKFFY